MYYLDIRSAIPLALVSLTYAMAASCEDLYASEIAYLERLGPRYTGNTAHNQLIDHIEYQLEALGLNVTTDHYTFDYLNMDKEGPKLTVDGQAIAISSTYPYSGFTNGTITAKLVPLISATLSPFAEGSIGLVQLSNPELSQSILIDTWNKSQSWGSTANPVAATSLNAKIPGAKAGNKVDALVFAWDESITDQNALGQYVPFTFDYVGIPAIFVSGNSSKIIVDAAMKGRSASLSVLGSLKPGTPSRTLWAVVEGTTSPEETIIIVTHTDGPNVVEENGYIAALQLARDVVSSKPSRTHVFVFVTGHLRIPAFTSHGQATSRWLDDHPEMWDGKPHHRKAVASLALEHFGAIQYTDDLKADRYQPTGRVEPELLYANTKELFEVTEALWLGADPSYTRISKPSLFLQFGEGAPLTAQRIPNVALVTTPLYLLAEWRLGNEVALVDMGALRRQIRSFQRLRTKIDGMESASFGVPGPLLSG